MGRATKRQIKALGLETDTPAEILKTVGMALRYPITANARAAMVERLIDISSGEDIDQALKAKALLMKADQMNQVDAAMMQRERHHAEEMAKGKVEPNTVIQVVNVSQPLPVRPALPGKDEE